MNRKFTNSKEKEILKEKILKLKKEKNAVILAHLYQNDDIQEIADFTGDSYYLSKIARDSKENLIIFCGVRFMAESAKTMSPEKTVILPNPDAGCPMADMAEPEMLKKEIEKYPDALKVCYINSSYEVKALCDVSVTSSSAIEIMKNIDNKRILFLPDKNLGEYISEFFPEKEFILWNGFCPTHHRIEKEEILELKRKHPNAKILSHPECTREIREISDYVGSTSGIIKYATESRDMSFIVCTESGILYSLKKNNPEKEFYFPEEIVCPNMKKIELDDLYRALNGEIEEITLDEKTRIKALVSLENMHKLGK